MAKAILFLAAYVGIALAMFPKVFTRVYISWGDLYSSIYSWNYFFKHCVTEGIFPLWDPLVLCGMPCGLRAISNFGITNILLLFLDVNSAWNARLVLTTALAGWCMFLFLANNVKLSTVSAFLGGCIFLSLSVDILNHVWFFVPLAFLFAERWLSSRKFFWTFLLGLTLAFYFLNSNPHYVLITCFFLYLYIVLILLSQRSGERVFIVLFKSAIPFGMAFGLVSFQLLPMLELARFAHREAYKYITPMLSPTFIVDCFYQDFYRSSLCPDLNFIPGRVTYQLMSLLFGQNRLCIATVPYLGVLPFLFFLGIFFKKNRTLRENIFMYFSVSTVAYVLFNPLVQIAVKHVPLLGTMVSVSRIFLIFQFCAVVLIAIVFDELFLKRKFDEFDTKRIAAIAGFVLWVLIAVTLMKLIIFCSLSLFGGGFQSLIKDNILPRFLERPWFKASSEFYYARLDQLVSFLKCWASPLNMYFIPQTIVIAVSAILLYLFIKMKGHRGLYVAAAFAVVFVDLFFISTQHYPSGDLTPFPPSELRPYSRVANFITMQPGVFRVMPLRDDVDEKHPLLVDTSSADTRSIIFRPESNTVYNIATPEGYRNLIFDRYIEFFRLLNKEGVKGLLIGEVSVINENIADLMNIKYVVTNRSKQLDGGYTTVYEDDHNRVFLNEDALERFFVVHKVKTVQDKDQALAELKKEDFDFSKEAIIEGSSLGPGVHTIGESTAKAEVSVMRYMPNNMEVEVFAPDDGFLVRTDCYYPGWRAFIDGMPAAIFRTDYVFQGINIPRGRHRIAFKYDPTVFKAGILVSCIFMVFGVACLLALRNKRF
ncbi:MAG: YfhO family protein [Candidatus Omnitrophica bacterium]|nr:YfhO family protein [Candidatus Omnitrophota bacterium]